MAKHKNEEEKAIHTKVSAWNTLVKCKERNGRDGECGVERGKYI